MLTVLTLLGATACGGDSGERTSGLRGALDAVRDDESTRAWFEYGDPSAVREADAGAGTDGPYSALVGVGYPDLATMQGQLPGALGFDPVKAREAWVAGRAPTRGGVLVGGFDKGTVTGRLVELGGTPVADDANVYRLRADGELSFDDALAQKLPLALDHFDVVRVSGSRIGYGASVRMADLSRGGTALGDDKGVRALADCLDKPLAAVLTDRAGGGERANGPRIAVGVRGAKGKTATEVLCVATGSKAAAETEADRLRGLFAGNGTTASGVPWTTLLTDVRVEVVDGDVVEVTAHPFGPTRTGVLLKALNDLSLGVVFTGGPPGRES